MSPDIHAASAAVDARLLASAHLPSTIADLPIDEPQRVVIPLSRGEAATFRDRYGRPSFELLNLQEGQVILVYQLEGEPGSHPYGRLEMVTIWMTGRHPEDQVHPEPGRDGWELAPEYLDAALVVFSLEQLETKFGVPAYDDCDDDDCDPVVPARDTIRFGMHEGLTYHGVIYRDQFDEQITIAFGKNQSEKVWDEKTMPLGRLVATLTNHKVGSKDGACFITGKPLGGKRTRNTIERMHIMGLDIDTGAPLASTIARIQELNLLAIIYTTHSHMKAVTDIAQTKFYNWAKKAGIGAKTDDLDQIKAFLADVRHYTPEIVASVSAVEERMDEGGIKLFITHDPLPKFRIMLPLARPWEFAQKGLSQQETIRSWGRKIFGMANHLGITVDGACIDPSRLFYGPRHAEGRPHEVHIIGGEKLDVYGLVESDSIDQSDPFAAVGHEMAGGDRDETYRFTKSGLNLWTWARERAIGFEAADAIKASAPAEFIRYHKESERKLIVRCPNDDAHSNPGDDQDVACMVMNAQDNDDRGFFFGCRHESCQGLKRTDMLCMAIEQGYLDEGALTDDAFWSLADASTASAPSSETPSGDATSLPAVDKLVQALTKASAAEEIERAILALVRLKPAKLTVGKLLKEIKKRTGTDLPDLRNMVQDARRDLRAERRKAGETARTDEGLLKIYPIEEGFPDALAASKMELLVKNNGLETDRNCRPRLFNFGNRLVRATAGTDGRLRILPLNSTAVVHELNRVARYINVTKAGENEIAPPKNISDLILVDDEASFPALERVAASPFFDRHGRLVHEPGYHWESRSYYDPPVGFSLPQIPIEPTSEEAFRAREFLSNNVFPDFPFDDGNGSGAASRAHAFALLLLPFCRQMIAGNTPVHFITKPAPGTGASLLVDSILMIQTGDAGTPHVQKEDTAEERKALTARLMTGASYFWLDNINDSVDSAVYALALTTGSWSDRVLGGSEEVTLPVTWSWIFSGNNVDVSAEMSRRLAPIRLDAKGNPLKREDFKHKDLTGWIVAHRPNLVAACLTMIRYWISKGCPSPQPSAPILRSYENWSRTMGGILETVGIPGFLSNLHLAQASVMDVDSGFESLIGAWSQFPNHADPRPIVLNYPGGGRHSLVDLMEENEIDLGIKGFEEPAKVKALSKILNKRDGRAVTVEHEDGSSTELILRSRMSRTKTREFWLQPAG